MADFYERGRESQPLLWPPGGEDAQPVENDLAQAEENIINAIKESKEGGAWRSQLTVWHAQCLKFLPLT